MINPFQPTKFEHENKPKVWLSSWARALAKSKKPDFVVGTRGSGKTTVLRSLHSKILFENEFLAEQFERRHFHWFGCYMQFNHSFQHLTEDVQKYISLQLGREPTELDRYKLFCTFFELSLIESLLEDLRSLEDREMIHFSGRKEFEACTELASVFSDLGLSHVKKLADYSDALRLVRSMRSTFLAIYDAGKLAEALMVIDAFVPTTLIKLIKERIIPSIMHPRIKRGAEVELFIMLDDCENLSDLQQKSLNTYLRSTEGTAKWIVAYVRGEYNTVETTIPETSLSHADRKFCNVDELSDEDFRTFCESVAALRLRSFITGNRRKVLKEELMFSLQAKCGDPSYNSLVEEAIGAGYQSAKINSFRTSVGKTKLLLNEVLDAAIKPSFHVEPSKAPFTEHVVLTSLDLDIFRYPTRSDQVRLRKEIYRKEAAAYIAACLECGRSPIYAGARFVMWASDGNIRDFLDIMAEFFEKQTSGKNSRNEDTDTLARACRNFLNNSRSFGFRFQDDAIKSVSRQSYETIEEMQETGDAHQFFLLAGLSELQKLLHQFNAHGEAVRYPERGVFVVNTAQFSGVAYRFDHPDLTKLLRRIERDGFIRVLDVHGSIGKDDIAFRLHRRLAAHLECSPRGAYETTRIDPQSLLRLMQQTEAITASDWAKDYFDRVVGHDTRQSRFEV